MWSFSFLNIFTTKSNSVRERVKNALSCALLYFKWKVLNGIIWDFSPTNTHLLKTSHFLPQFLQIYSSTTLHLSPKKPNFRWVKEADFHKNQNLALTNYWTFLFSKGFHEKSAETDFSKEMWVPISKGLKHLNTVINTVVNTNTNTMAGACVK